MSKQTPVLARRGMIGTDIERYSQRSVPDQHEAQRVYDWVIGQAAEHAGLRCEEWQRQSAGDGEFIVLPEGVHEPRVIGMLLPAAAARLREYNRSRTTECRVRLRVAIHHGLIHLDGAQGFPGASAVQVARLLDSTPVREVLRLRPGINLAAIVSREVFEDIVANRYADLRPELFQSVRVEKAGKLLVAEAWVYAPEEDVTRPPHTTARS